jgi:hypothetical protein
VLDRFEFAVIPEDARRVAERQAVEFSVEIGTAWCGSPGDYSSAFDTTT